MKSTAYLLDDSEYRRKNLKMGIVLDVWKFRLALTVGMFSWIGWYPG